MKIIGKIVKLKLKIEKLTTGKTEKLKSQVRQITVKSVKSPTQKKLFQVLQGKKFLLLLDDVWENIDLQAVGIPDPSIENGCKIIMASRKRGSLETIFKQVGGIIDLPEIQPFARAIVEGCGGLPLLIIVTRRALAEETNISVWKHASSWKDTSAGLTEPPSEEEWRQAKTIFLMDNDLCTLPEKPNCPELSQLFMQRNSKLRVIPTSFFDLMASLTVLNLSRNRIRSLPKTLFKLINLEILILRYCDCQHVLPSEVGFLERLEVLDLHGTEVIKLPEEIGKLASLIQLEVSLYGSIDYTEYVRLPQKLISNGIISKLHKLENLIENLELFLQTSIAWNTQRLSEFKFVVGPDVNDITSRVPNYIEFDYHQQGQCLRFVNSETIPEAILKVWARSTVFYLDYHLGVRNLIEFGVSNINRLKFCTMSECPNIETILESNKLTEAVFPILENLSMHDMWNLTSLCEGIMPAGSFAGLRILTVDSDHAKVRRVDS
ncbi:hypothetical protein Patl1_26713 [Pistacia atlantica]|uniref:Uncharacterized protein n=1 Tax=Pistacia atlantica TaxID=434234 RepID=A0ACC1AZ27_9ROSI|nr:hypothetical protein Patl1_26713 [Pistacia atlantica]